MSRSFEITGSQLKSHIFSSKSFKFTTDGGNLEPRGQVILEIKDASSVDLYLHRLSGNGHFNIELEESHEFKIVLSKSPQEFSFPFKSGQIKIYRPKSAVGQISLTKVKVYTEEEEDTVPKNWRNLIKRCGRYGSLRLVKDQLFASSGGFIEDYGLIEIIKTQPENVFVREGDRIKFLSSCEITSLTLRESTSPQREEMFASRNAPTPNINPVISVPSVGNVNPISMPKPIVDLSHAVKGASLVVYDSSALKGFQKYLHVKSKMVSAIRSNGKEYLLLRQAGTASLSISTLNSDKDYICIVTGKCLNGNGKIFANISSREGDLSHYQEMTLLKAPNFEHKYIHIKAPKLKYGEQPKINLHMPKNGEVLIERVLIVDSLDIRQARETIEGRTFSSQIRAVPQTITGDVQVDSTDPVYQKSKKYARYEPINLPNQLDIKGAVFSNTPSGLLWINKIKSICPNINIENTSGALFITDVKAPSFTSKIWLEPFNQLTNEQSDKLRHCKEIFTSSDFNSQMLTNKYPDIKIKLVTKPLPWTNPHPVNLFKDMDYFVAFHRDNEITQFLINNWDSSLPKLVLIGARGAFDANILPVNEYLSYPKLLYILQQSRSLIDINKVYHANFSFQELAIDLGLPILTNSWPALTDDRMVFLPTQRGLPAPKGFSQGVDRVMAQKKRQIDFDAINKRFESKVHSLLS